MSYEFDCPDCRYSAEYRTLVGGFFDVVGHVCYRHQGCLDGSLSATRGGET